MSDFYAATAAAPGWYSDPQNAASLRYWDGPHWTEHIAPAQVAPTPVVWGNQPLPPPLGVDPSDPVHWMLPTGRTWQSIVAGYIALFALLFWFLGPGAFAFGIWALMESHKTGARGRGRAIFAIVVGVLSTFVLYLFVTDQF